MAGGECLLDDESSGAAGGSEHYKVHWTAPLGVKNVSKLKLQVGKLKRLEASTYSKDQFHTAPGA